MRWAALLLSAVALGACSGRPESTPLPTKQTTIDPVRNKLDNAAQEDARRREQMEEASKQ
jgi:hypothetical protein